MQLLPNNTEEACGLTWEVVYNIKAGDKIMFLETNSMANMKQPLNHYYWVAKQY